MIQAIFFDIDGTLIPHGNKKIVDSALKALWTMKKKGIKIFVATGRPPSNIDYVLNQFPFDGYLAANGQYCFCDNHVIHEHYILKQHVQKVIPYIEKHKLPIVLATVDHCYINQYNKETLDSTFPVIDLHHLDNMNILQIMSYMPKEQDEDFLSHLPGCVSARWSERFADIIPMGGGKDQGIDKVIEYYHIPLENVMAFGDGENDISMLQHVPYGVAMGNANEIVKAAASYTTSHIDEEGVVNALIHFHVIKKEDI